MVAGLAEILHRLAHATDLRCAAFGGTRGGGRVVQAPEHVAYDGPSLVAEQVKHIADLEVAEALHQSRKQEHADDDHDPDQQHRE